MQDILTIDWVRWLGLQDKDPKVVQRLVPKLIEDVVKFMVESFLDEQSDEEIDALAKELKPDSFSSEDAMTLMSKYSSVFTQQKTRWLSEYKALFNWERFVSYYNEYGQI